jgi:hypothetical protein
MRYLLAVIIIIFLFESCTPKADLLTKKTYTAEKIGWTINLPGQKWKVITERELKKMSDKGKALIEDATEMKIDNSEVENLINLKKNTFNYFLASIEPYDSVSFNNYDEMVKTLHEVLKASYHSKKIPAEYEIGATRIDGLMLDRYIIKIPPKAPGGKPFYQEIYTCLINNFVLEITLMYNNDNDKETLSNILQSSNFTLNSAL